jgi:hypothetical protein
MPNNRGDDAMSERHAAAAHLTTMLEELMPLAQRNGLPVVAYLLDLALMEAKSVASQPPDSPGPVTSPLS